jgi:ADP-ribosylglycohydrolase
LYIYDALGMPAHLYNDLGALKRDYGTISTFQAPLDRHPEAVLPQCVTTGREGEQMSVIGDVINHDKKRHWGSKGLHYHQGFKAGENTLNALCVRDLVRAMAETGGYDCDAALESYIKFMTTPGSHNDTHADSFHRNFFANYARGLPPLQCARNTEGYNAAQIGGLVMLVPVVLAVHLRGKVINPRSDTPSPGLSPGRRTSNPEKDLRSVAVDAAIRQLRLTHDSPELETVATVFAGLLFDLAGRKDPKTSLEAAIVAIGRSELIALAASDIEPTRAVHDILGPSGYIGCSIPAVFFLAYRYLCVSNRSGWQVFTEAAMVNANSGGETCHRGAVLGALMGAALGMEAVPAALRNGLCHSKEILNEIEAFIENIYKGG